MVLEAQSSTIIKFLEGLLPAQGAEQPCLQAWHKDGYRATSYKDIHAQAHCVAGYLMRRGLKQGDSIGIIGMPGLRYHVLHIALQFLGVVNVTFPPELSTEEVEQMAFRYDFKMLYVDTVAQFQAHGEFKDLKAGLLGVIVGEDEVDALEPEKVVTYDRVVTIGKSAWREEAGQIRDLKAAVMPQTVCAVLVEPNGRTTTLTMAQWMASVEAAAKVLETAAAKSILLTLAPDRLLWRSYSFAAMLRRTVWWVYPTRDINAAQLATVKPEVILLPLDDLRNYYGALPGIIDTADKGRKAITAALDVVRKRDQALADGKKDPFFNRLRYRTRNRKLYARIRTKLGGTIAAFVTDHGPIDGEARLLLQECGCTFS